MSGRRAHSFVIHYHDTRPDEKGKRKFTLSWVDAYGRERAQEFNADPAIIIANCDDLVNEVQS